MYEKVQILLKEKFYTDCTFKNKNLIRVPLESFSGGTTFLNMLLSRYEGRKKT